ncbi:alpha/beta fold hydrolase [Phnomibacter sp. MR]|uniref:alpha/beta fold hydrolase n=1 Tax=Phnomibacter sp. MR TaxID=3042318 RepID=UPI003A80974F
MQDLFVTANGIQLHAIDWRGNGPVLLLAHGLTANAHAFDGLIAAGLNNHCRIIAVDLRGRGQSEAPDMGYSMAETAKDIIGLMDKLQLDNVMMGGHSYGAFLSWYLAAYYPKRISKVIALDAAMKMHPNTMQMLGPALGRLGKVFGSFEAYVQQVKTAPYLSFWEDAMASYYQADVHTAADGSVATIPCAQHMTEAATKVLAEPWADILKAVTQPVLMCNAPGIYTMEAPLLPEENALETAALLQDVQFVKVDGNHQTMLYGAGATQIVDAIASFI